MPWFKLPQSIYKATGKIQIIQTSYSETFTKLKQKTYYISQENNYHFILGSDVVSMNLTAVE